MTAEPTLPAAKVAEVLQLIGRFLSQEVAAPRAERYQTLGMNPHAARAFALANRLLPGRDPPLPLG